MRYSALGVANYFIQKAFDEDNLLTRLWVMKMCYISYGWHAQLKGDALFEESIQANQYGPFVEAVRIALFENIPKKYAFFNLLTVNKHDDDLARELLKTKQLNRVETNVKDSDFLDDMYKAHKKISNGRLSYYCRHGSDKQGVVSAFYKILIENDGYLEDNPVIPFECIKEDFRKIHLKANENKDFIKDYKVT
tara:strand:+ start:46729 stop:47307 length:579 start_codon:yes stop_codon:yes gene_type:complete